VILMAVLFGLAMDYEVFLVSRMREEYVHGAAPREAVVTGARHASRVVVAAALIMFSVFASFVAVEDVVVKAIAVGLAVGILVDAFVVRMTLVPAVLALLGRSAWWLPRWLDRLLPDLDVEGARLGPVTTPEESRPVTVGS
jgi:putative drug exporter of the RND superfamily